MNKQKKVPKGIFSRATKLIGLTGQIAAQEAGLMIKKKVQRKIAGTELETRLKQATVVKETLSELKGAAMKVGQLVSLDVNEYLPKEVTEVFSELQAQSKSVEFKEIESVLKSSLGDSYSLVKHISEEPIASASIGQVHTANYMSEKIVLKVQYPGVRESIPSDMKLLEKLINSMSQLLGKKIDYSSTLDEIKTVLLLETDYLNEFKHINKTYETLKGHEKFIVPKPIKELSTENVLAMSFKEGISLNDWILSHPSKEERLEVADLLMQLFFLEFFQWHRVQTDPNLANFLIQTDPIRIVLLDFGATLEYEPEFVERYKKFLKLTESADIESLFNEAVDFGLIDNRESKQVARNFYEMIKVSCLPFMPDSQPFDFTSVEYERRSRQVILKFIKDLKHTPPPKKLIFLHRKLGGLFGTFKKMQLQFDLRPYWEKI